jgi:hypothetical protein
MMNPRRNVKGAITALGHQNVTAELAMWYCDIIITVATTVHKGGLHVE